MALPLRQVDAGLQGVDLGGGQHLGEVVSQHGRLQQFCGVVVTIAVQLQETIERAHTTEYATLRTGMDADVVQSCGKVLQVFQLHIQGTLALLGQVVQQLLQVAHIGVQRVRRVSALQLQVALVGANDICR